MQTAQTTHSPSHSYANAGDYQVKISGAFPRIYCGVGGWPYLTCLPLRSIDQWGDNAWTSMENAFAGAKNLQILASDVPNLSGVTNMSWMFVYAENLTGNFSGWDTRNVTDMSYMFYQASRFNQPLDSWNVSNVTNMSHMFYSASSFNQPLGSWNVDKVQNMDSMFSFASSFNQPLDSWNVGNVTNMSYMFQRASSFNQDISNWCVNKITSEPQNFSISSPLTSAHKPRWGTCPARPFITTWRTTSPNQTITIPGT